MGNKPKRARRYRAGVCWGSVSSACPCHLKLPKILFSLERETEQREARREGRVNRKKRVGRVNRKKRGGRVNRKKRGGRVKTAMVRWR